MNVYNTARILAILHEADIIFCDLSPDNIIINGEGHLYVSDLEFARGAAGPPFAGAGAYGFFPLRHVTRPPQTPSIQRDLYALGALLHSLLAPGWYRSLADLTFATYQEAWERPPLAADTLPGFQIMIDKLMHRRYTSVKEVLKDLHVIEASLNHP